MPIFGRSEKLKLCLLTVKLFYDFWLLSLLLLVLDAPQGCCYKYAVRCSPVANLRPHSPRDLKHFRDSPPECLAYFLSKVVHLLEEGQNRIIKEWL